MGDVGQEGCSRFAAPRAHIRRRGRTLGGHETLDDEGDDDAGNDNDGAEDRCPLPVLAGEPSGEDDGDQPVGSDDVTGEEHGVGRAEEDHPQATAPHQATGVHGGLLTGPDLLLRRRLTPGLHTGEGLKIVLRPGGDAPVDHGGQSETEQHREQRIGPGVDQKSAHPQPGRV